jgi:hypothetical protein
MNTKDTIWQWIGLSVLAMSMKFAEKQRLTVKLFSWEAMIYVVYAERLI